MFGATVRCSGINCGPIAPNQLRPLSLVWIRWNYSQLSAFRTVLFLLAPSVLRSLYRLCCTHFSSRSVDLWRWSSTSSSKKKSAYIYNTQIYHSDLIANGAIWLVTPHSWAWDNSYTMLPDPILRASKGAGPRDYHFNVAIIYCNSGTSLLRTSELRTPL